MKKRIYNYNETNQWNRNELQKEKKTILQKKNRSKNDRNRSFKLIKKFLKK